ncbi:MAG: NTP transferase domain-containing protein [Armatimonadetes bacterium]|nr:NTP transferase domain-containing protein [Armatimonadota bacterium]
MEHQALAKAWGVVIAAGGSVDPAFAKVIGADTKALAELGGRPSASFVIDACVDAGFGRIVLAAQGRFVERLQPLPLSIEVAESGNSSIGTVRSGMSRLEPERPIVFVPCDSPLITGPHLLHFIAGISRRLGDPLPEKWFAAGFCTEADARKTHPGAHNKGLKFRGGALAPGGLYAASSAGVEAALAILEEAAGNRKSQFKMVWRFGLLNVAGYFLGTVTPAEAESRVGTILGGPAIIVHGCDPDTTIDFDNPEDWAYLVDHFAARAPAAVTEI